MYSFVYYLLIVFTAFSFLLQGQINKTQSGLFSDEGRPGFRRYLSNSVHGEIKRPSLLYLKSAQSSASDGIYVPENVEGDTVRQLYYSDGSGLVMWITTQCGQNGNFVNYSRDSYEYDVNRNVISVLFQNWENNSWSIRQINRFTYDNANRLLTCIEENWYNNSFNSYQYRYTYDYTPTGKLKQILREVWFINDWVNSRLTSRTYNTDDNLTSLLVQFWDTDHWRNFQVQTYTYDTEGNYITWEFQYWDNNQWNNSEREFYTYDNSHNMLAWLYDVWENNAWSTSGRGEFTYDSQNNLLTKLFQYTDGSNWFNSEKYTYTYDGLGNAVLGKHHIWSSNTWVPAWGNIYLYYNLMAECVIIYSTSASASYHYYPTGVGAQLHTPVSLNLLQNYPNPFNPVTNISFTLNATRKVKLAVYDMLGNEQAVLVNEEKTPGNYTESFDACDLPSGVYFYKLTAGRETRTGKMVLLK